MLALFRHAAMAQQAALAPVALIAAEVSSSRSYHVARLVSRGVISMSGTDCVQFLQVFVEEWICENIQKYCSRQHAPNAFPAVISGYDYQRYAATGATRWASIYYVC
jgi:hypothetical protein